MIITYTNASHDDKDKELLTPHVGLHGWLFLSSSSVTDGSIGLGYIIHSWKRTKTPYNSIFPLRLNTHAHTRELIAHRKLIFRPEMFLHIFHTHCSKYYRRVLVKCCTKDILCAHTFKS